MMRRPARRGWSAGAALLVASAALAGCSHFAPGAYVDRRMAEAGAPEPTSTPAPAPLPPPPRGGGEGVDSAAHPSTSPSEGPPSAEPPLPSVVRPGVRGPVEPGPLPSPAHLADLLDLALSRDPATRAAWFEARAAAAAAGARRADYLPSLDLTGRLQQDSAPLTSGGGEHPIYGSASAQLTWLLLDLGERGARGEAAELELEAATLAHQAAALDLALAVEVAWFQYQTARALAEASEATVKQAQASLEAAEARRRSGVATVADVLQARTSRSQAALDAQRLEGQVLSLRGALATLVGLPPTTALEVVPLPANLPPDLAIPAVEQLLEQAAARNPELARARAQAGAADARATAASRTNLPTLSVGGTAGTIWPLAPSGAALEAWTAGLVLSVPLVDGGRARFDAQAAREAARAAHERAAAAERGARLDVWTSLQSLRTSGRRIETSRDLLASAEAGLEVAAARYKEGVGSILDLMAAQNSLASARAEEILARADWLVAIARLARATGRALPASDGALR